MSLNSTNYRRRKKFCKYLPNPSSTRVPNRIENSTQEQRLIREYRPKTLRLKSGKTLGQGWAGLSKAWKGFKWAKREQNRPLMAYYAKFIVRVKKEMRIDPTVFDDDLVEAQPVTAEENAALVSQSTTDNARTCDYTPFSPLPERTCDYIALDEAKTIIINERPRAIPYPSEEIYGNANQTSNPVQEGNYTNSQAANTEYKERENQGERSNGFPVHPFIADYPENSFSRRRKKRIKSVDPNQPASPFMRHDKGMRARFTDRPEKSCLFPGEDDPRLTREQREAYQKELNRSRHSEYFRSTT